MDRAVGCNGESTGSSLRSNSHCVRALSKSFTHNCPAPSVFCRMIMHALMNFGRRPVSYTIVLHSCMCCTEMGSECRLVASYRHLCWCCFVQVNLVLKRKQVTDYLPAMYRYRRQRNQQNYNNDAEQSFDAVSDAATDTHTLAGLLKHVHPQLHRPIHGQIHKHNLYIHV